MASFEYRPAPELVRAHERITQALAAEMRRAQTSTNLRGADVMARLLPLIESVVGLTAMVQGDLAAYTAQVVGDDEGGDVIFGIDPDTFEDLDKLCKQALHEMTEVLDIDINGAKPKVRAAMEHISELREALSELVLEVDEDGSEPLEEGSDEMLDIEE